MKYLGNDRPLDRRDRERPPLKGPARYFQALWDNLGALFGGNLLASAGFLPLALGVSLGTVYENFWLTLLGGALGGALAGPVWVPLLALCVQALRDGTRGWWRRWRAALLLAPGPAALLGGTLGLLGGGLLLVGEELARLTVGAVPMVSVVLLLDLLLLALAAAAYFPALCAGERSPRAALGLALRGPLRTLGAAVGLLVWGGLLVGLFPVSVPFAVVLGFWPPALLCAQLMLPMLEDAFDLSLYDGAEEERRVSTSLTVGERSEIFWRRRWPLVLGLAALTGLIFWGGNQLLNRQEPDVQIAVVHARPLPDPVIAALEQALAEQVGDRNGDGTALAQVNDYTVVFDGSAAEPDRQTAGTALLTADLAAGQSALYAVEDPEGFLERYGDRVDARAAALWGDLAGLCTLEAGAFPDPEDPGKYQSGRKLLEGLTVLPAPGADEVLRAIAPVGFGTRAFDLDKLTGFFHENLDAFERLKAEVAQNDIPFQLSIWGGKTSLVSTEKRDVSRDDIAGFDSIISDMSDLHVTTVHYFGIAPTKMTLFFSSNSDGATLYMSYGRSEDEIGGQLFGCIPLYDQWLAFAMVAE